MAGITSDLTNKPGDQPRVVSGWSPDDFRRDNIACPHGRLLCFSWFKSCVFPGLKVVFFKDRFTRINLQMILEPSLGHLGRFLGST